MLLNTADVYQKLSLIEDNIHQALTGQIDKDLVPKQPARDLPVLKPEFHPDKKGLASQEGKARLLHDLASIELQAMELGLRTLIEFPEAPAEFKNKLAEITLSEAKHLQLCLQGIETLGFEWGFVPVHTLLWAATDKEDSLLDRILIVHRYLEGSGLDAGETLTRRLSGVADSCVHRATQVIFTEELDHVLFGSDWYKAICKMQNLDPETDYPQRMDSLRYKLPKRIEKISREIRKQAGFSDSELNYLEHLRESMIKYR